MALRQGHAPDQRLDARRPSEVGRHDGGGQGIHRERDRDAVRVHGGRSRPMAGRDQRASGRPRRLLHQPAGGRRRAPAVDGSPDPVRPRHRQSRLYELQGTVSPCAPLEHRPRSGAAVRAAPPSRVPEWPFVPRPLHRAAVAGDPGGGVCLRRAGRGRRAQAGAALGRDGHGVRGQGAAAVAR